jgi:hypothetical protein
MKLFKKIQIITIIFISILFIGTNVALSQEPILKDTIDIGEQTDAFRNTSGYAEPSDSGSISDIIAQIIYIALSLLATVFLVLIIMSGYQWMTAGGNEETISKAKKNLSNAVIGLIIILSAYAVTWFIFNYLPMSAGTGVGDATTDSSG